MPQDSKRERQTGTEMGSLHQRVVAVTSTHSCLSNVLKRPSSSRLRNFNERLLEKLMIGTTTPHSIWNTNSIIIERLAINADK